MRDPDSEDLSSFNGMFKGQDVKKLQALEEAEKKGTKAT